MSASTLPPALRHRLDVQGFGGVDEETLAQTQLWLRFSPALCAIVAAIGTTLASPAVLWGLAVVAALGALLPFHPFDLIYNLALRRIAGTPEMPRNGAPRRFACGLASVWLTATGALFAGGLDPAAYVLGGALVVTAGIISLSHICIPSICYGFAARKLHALPR